MDGSIFVLDSQGIRGMNVSAEWYLVLAQCVAFVNGCEDVANKDSIQDTLTIYIHPIPSVFPSPLLPASCKRGWMCDIW
jgi:hypothetical protein